MNDYKNNNDKKYLDLAKLLTKIEALKTKKPERKNS